MKNILSNELTKLFLFILCSFLGAALLSPHLYVWGKGLAAAHAPIMQDPGFWDSPQVWLANKCERAEFSRFFNRALMGCALLLLIPLIRSLKSDHAATTPKAPLLSRISPQRQGWQDLAMGFLFAAGFLTLLVVLLFQIGWVELDPAFVFGKAFKKAIIPAVIVALLEEWLFRGVLFGVLRRKLSANATILGLSVFFAAVHFLSPPKGVEIADPSQALAGFEMLGLIGHKFLGATSFLGTFLTLLTVGIILAYTRHKTGKLWLGIGLHAGWVFSLKFTNRLTAPTDSSHALLYNNSLMEGLLPLATLLVTAAALALYLRTRKPCFPQR